MYSPDRLGIVTEDVSLMEDIRTHLTDWGIVTKDD